MEPTRDQAAALMIGQYKDAAEDATAAAQLAAGSADGLRAHVRAGKAHLIMGHFDQVRASYVCLHALQVVARLPHGKVRCYLQQHQCLPEVLGQHRKSLA